MEARPLKVLTGEDEFSRRVEDECRPPDVLAGQEAKARSLEVLAAVCWHAEEERRPPVDLAGEHEGRPLDVLASEETEDRPPEVFASEDEIS